MTYKENVTYIYMASTSNKNMKNEYCLEQKQNTEICNDRLYIQRRTAYHNALPCVGVNVGGMPSNVLSYNPVEIESNLFGINSTNLVAPQREMTPRIKNLPNVAFFDRMKVFLPEPLTIEKNQRPEYL